MLTSHVMVKLYFGFFGRGPDVVMRVLSVIKFAILMYIVQDLLGCSYLCVNVDRLVIIGVEMLTLSPAHTN